MTPTYPRVDPILAARALLAEQTGIAGAMLPGWNTPQFSPGTVPDDAPPAFLVYVREVGWQRGVGDGLTTNRREAHVYRPGDDCHAWDYDTGVLADFVEIVPMDATPNEEAGPMDQGIPDAGVREGAFCGWRQAGEDSQWNNGYVNANPHLKVVLDALQRTEDERARLARLLPLDTDAMPGKREWDDVEWMRNQLHMSNEAYDAAQRSVDGLTAELAQARERLEAITLDALRWRSVMATIRLEETGDIEMRVAMGSSDNVEETVGRWPESIREKLLRGTELYEDADILAVFDHAHAFSIEAQRDALDAGSIAPGAGKEEA